MLNDDLDRIMASVTEENTIIDSVEAFIAALKQQVIDATSGAVSPEVQAKLDNIFSLNETQKTRLATAIVTGTPEGRKK
jgi:beta-phosphoglucomutase-like phosphatase (HAD superfamily)